MANSLTVQTLQDGPRNAVFKVEGVMDTADYSAQVLIDPSTLNSMQPGRSGGPVPNRVAIQEIQWSVEDGTTVLLYWDATTPVLIAQYDGRGINNYRPVGNLQNNGGAGVTGKITLTTSSNTTPSGTNILHFSFLIWCVKNITTGGA